MEAVDGKYICVLTKVSGVCKTKMHLIRQLVQAVHIKILTLIRA